MPKGEKFSIRDKEPGFFDTFFGTDRHEKEIADSSGSVVATIRDKPSSIFDSLLGVDKHEKEVTDSQGNRIATIRDKEPGIFDSFLAIDRHEQQVRGSRGEPIGTVRDKEPGIFDSFVGIDRHEKEVRDSSGNRVASIRDKQPGILDSLVDIDRHEREVKWNRDEGSIDSPRRPAAESSLPDSFRHSASPRRSEARFFAAIVVCFALIAAWLWFAPNVRDLVRSRNRQSLQASNNSHRHTRAPKPLPSAPREPNSQNLAKTAPAPITSTEAVASEPIQYPRERSSERSGFPRAARPKSGVNVASAPPPVTLVFWAKHKHTIGSCNGQLQLAPDGLLYVSSKHMLRISRAEIMGISGDGIVDGFGKRWHFKIEHKSSFETQALLTSWLQAYR